MDPKGKGDEWGNELRNGDRAVLQQRCRILVIIGLEMGMGKKWLYGTKKYIKFRKFCHFYRCMARTNRRFC